ncbi:ArsR family transcriptional regulator [Streptomyces griseofuscus]|uniref:MarR family transcriptional regulator n=1 Tax=Streptomyces griseofuscus TaxID=146922 RepID=UPI000F653A82|nr:MarR family transcriptional regulator [Streptomyces griseofuscus]RRQ73060.1 ArsR family transcriptional regulator [Streptomyces griseofuscus]
MVRGRCPGPWCSTEAPEAARVEAGLGGLPGPLRRAVLRATRNVEGLPDLPEAQLELLRVLSSSPEGLSPGSAATRVRVAPSTVSNLVRAMSAAQLVERVRPDHDQRTVVLNASKEALNLLEPVQCRQRPPVGVGQLLHDAGEGRGARPVVGLVTALESGESTPSDSASP